MLNVGGVLVTVLRLFLFALLGRLILDYVRMFSRTWRPRGILLFLVEAIYAVTDKPMRFVRRFIPPLRLGSVSLDLSFLVLFFVVQLAIPLVSRL
jgi:YggT family protein